MHLEVYILEIDFKTHDFHYCFKNWCNILRTYNITILEIWDRIKVALCRAHSNKIVTDVSEERQYLASGG
jgi:hypothetical protein